jgi:N-formylglutamate deformylase
VSLPHVGTEIPAGAEAELVERALGVEDTDWHLEPLYAFARELGAGMLVPRHSRYVIDLNRPPENTPMYAGANNTELVPTRFFSGEPLYRAPLADEGRDRPAPRRLLAAVPRRARRRARRA